MRKISFALVAAGLLAVSALPATASEKKSEPGVAKNDVTKSQSQAGSVDLSARRYYRGRYYRGGGYRYGYSRPYYRPYAYGPAPYYGYGYYRPAPFPFFPFFF
jgi:hypothetical protein